MRFVKACKKRENLLACRNISYVFFCLQINFVFLISVLREICAKAAATPASCASTPSPHQTRRNLLRAPTSPEKAPTTRASLLVSLRAACLLLPLYGLHYLVVVYRMNTSLVIKANFCS